MQNVPVLKSRLNSTSFPDTQVVHLHQRQHGCPSASCAWHEINVAGQFAASCILLFRGVCRTAHRVHLGSEICNLFWHDAVCAGYALRSLEVNRACLCYLVQDLVVQVVVKLSKFGWTVFFQDLVVQVLVHFVFFPRLGCPSFGMLFFPRLGCPRFGCFSFFQDLVVQVLDRWLSKFWFILYFFSKTWLSKFWLFFFFPRLGCPSFGCFSSFPRLGCSSFGSLFFSKTWSSKFWFVVFPKTWLSKLWFVFPRLGCPSFGSCCFLRLGCPSFGLSKRLFIFCFLCIPRLGCPSFGKLDHVFFPGLGFHVLAHVSSSHCVFKDVCRKMPTYAFAGWSCGKSSFTCCYIGVDEGLERKHLEDSRTLVSRLFLSLMLKLSSYSQMFCVPFLPAWPNNTQENMSRTIWSWFGPWRHKKQLLESCLTDDIPKRTYGNNNNNVHCSRCCSVNRHGAQGHWLHFIVCTFVDHGFGNDFFCPSCISSSGEEDKLSQETRSLAFTCRRRNQCHQCAISNYAT